MSSTRQPTVTQNQGGHLKLMSLEEFAFIKEVTEKDHLDSKKRMKKEPSNKSKRPGNVVVQNQS